MTSKENAPTREDDFEDCDGPLNESVGHSEPVSSFRRDDGLGLSMRQQNTLIVQLHEASGYEENYGGTLTMRKFNDFGEAGEGDDALTINLSGKLGRMANFPQNDFVVTEACGHLIDETIERFRKEYPLITRRHIHRMAVIILASLWWSFGPAKVRMKGWVKSEVLRLSLGEE